MITVLLALIFACSAFNVFFLMLILFEIAEIKGIANFFMTVKKREAKLHLNSMYGKMVYADTDSVRTEKEGKHDKN